MSPCPDSLHFVGYTHNVTTTGTRSFDLSRNENKPMGTFFLKNARTIEVRKTNKKQRGWWWRWDPELNGSRYASLRDISYVRICGYTRHVTSLRRIIIAHESNFPDLVSLFVYCLSAHLLATFEEKLSFFIYRLFRGFYPSHTWHPNHAECFLFTHRHQIVSRPPPKL